LRTRLLVTAGIIVVVIVAAGSSALARNRVETNARSQLHRTLDDDGQAVDRLARFDAATLIDATVAPPSETEFKQAQTVADRLWLLSPRLSGGLRGDGRDAARALDEAIFELKVLVLVTSGNRAPSSTPPPAQALDASRAAYDTRVRPTNTRLPDWGTIAANSTMRRVARDLERLDRRVDRS
jgi:hypothetical protein